MTYYAMQRKLENEGAVDVSGCARTPEGDYILEQFTEDVDYCDARTERWIWSIGRRNTDGVILASTSTKFYQHPHFECLWLR